MIPVPNADIMALISALAQTLSREVFSTFRILPRRGSTAWFSRQRAILAEPPAESPSTIKSSHSLGSRPEQSASLPGRARPARAVLRRARSLALLAAALAFFARTALFRMALAAWGFCSRNRVTFSYTRRSTTGLAELLPSFCLVCPSNCGSFKRTLTMATMPSDSSSLEREESHSFNNPCFLAYSLTARVRACLKPLTWVPPSGVDILLAKLKSFSS